MDRLVYVAMSGAKETLRAQAANNHNLANANTNGFRADLSAFQTKSVVGPGLPSRAYATNDVTGWDSSSGSLDATGRDLDVAIKGPGWIAVQASDGTEAYTRAGDLRVDPNGTLMTATGNPVLGDSGPITVPPYTSINIGTRRLGFDRAARPDADDHVDRRAHQAGQSGQRPGRTRQRRTVPQHHAAPSSTPMPPCTWCRARSSRATSTSPKPWPT